MMSNRMLLCIIAGLSLLIFPLHSLAEKKIVRKNKSAVFVRRNPHLNKYPRKGLFAVTNTCNWVIKDGKRHNLFDYDVDGVSNYMTWRMVEPIRGKFRFPGFERMMREAVSSNKLMAYHILAGIHAPDWVYEQAGIKQYIYSYPSGKKVKTFLPWKVNNGKRVLNTDMLKIWKQTIFAFSDYIYNHPHRDRIYYVAITGWPFGNGLELMMGMTKYSEYKALNWNKEAYELFVEYCKKCVDIYIEAFPDIPLGLAFADWYGITPKGKPKRSYWQSREVVEYALKRAKIKGATVVPMGLWLGSINVHNRKHPLISLMREFKKDALGVAFEGPMGSYHSFYTPLEDQLKFAVEFHASWVQLWHHDIIHKEFQGIIRKYRALLHNN